MQLIYLVVLFRFKCTIIKNKNFKENKIHNFNDKSICLLRTVVVNI